MKKIICLGIFVVLASVVLADWDPIPPEDPTNHKMHWAQLPNPIGWDVNATHPKVLADDWQCSQTGWIWDIHFWGSWKDDSLGTITSFHLSIHKNIVDGGYGYSIPGELEWEHDFIVGEFDIRGPYEGTQGWFDPNTGEFIVEDHFNYYQYNFFLPVELRIPQVLGTIYWLDVSAHITNADSLAGRRWGWKTSISPHFMDNAVWGDFPDPVWEPLFNPIEPFESLDLAFVINGEDYLPVELSSFNAFYEEGNAVLCWTTQSETNNIGWNVYRSDSNDFETSQQINYELILGVGTTTQPTDYQFTDEYTVIEGNTYWYWLESFDMSGETDHFGPIALTIPGEGTVPDLPTQTLLSVNYPNPFNPNTFIGFSVKEGETATLTISNVKGQELESITYEPGTYTHEWDGTEYGSGIYFYKLESSSYSEIKKMLMVK